MSTDSTDDLAAPFVVTAPFDDASLADIVLRSSDGVDFYASKLILSIASPIFRDMFDIPTPSTSADDEEAGCAKDDLPVVTMYESSSTILDALLRVLYPVDMPRLDDYDVVAGMVSAARKYEMASVLSLLEQSVRQVIDKDGGKAVQLFVLARAYGLKDMARVVALESLKYPFPGPAPAELMNLPGASMADLWCFVHYRTEVARRVAKLFAESLDAEAGPWDILSNIYFCPIKDACWQSQRLGTTVDSEGYSADRYMSGIWDLWRLRVLAKLHAAPLAPGAVTLPSLLEEVQRSRCEYCKNKPAERFAKAVDALNEKIVQITTTVELD